MLAPTSPRPNCGRLRHSLGMSEGDDGEGSTRPEAPAGPGAWIAAAAPPLAQTMDEQGAPGRDVGGGLGTAGRPDPRGRPPCADSGASLRPHDLTPDPPRPRSRTAARPARLDG